MSSLPPLSSLPAALPTISLDARGVTPDQDDPNTFSKLLIREMVHNLHKSAGVFASNSPRESAAFCHNDLATELLSQWLGGRLAEQLGPLPGLQPVADNSPVL